MLVVSTLLSWTSNVQQAQLFPVQVFVFDYESFKYMLANGMKTKEKSIIDKFELKDGASILSSALEFR